MQSNINNLLIYELGVILKIIKKKKSKLQIFIIEFQFIKMKLIKN